MNIVEIEGAANAAVHVAADSARKAVYPWHGTPLIEETVEFTRGVAAIGTTVREWLISRRRGRLDILTFVAQDGQRFPLSVLASLDDEEVAGWKPLETDDTRGRQIFVLAYFACHSRMRGFDGDFERALYGDQDHDWDELVDVGLEADQTDDDTLYVFVKDRGNQFADDPD